MPAVDNVRSANMGRGRLMTKKSQARPFRMAC